MDHKVAVIGIGHWGKNLVRNFHDLGTLGCICDSNKALLDSFEQQYPHVPATMDLTAALGRDDLDAVAIATPAETHYAIARRALEAGKHVFVEKPLALHVTEAQQLVDLARKRDRRLMVGHLLQYHPAFLRLKELAKDNAFGRINYIYSHRLNLGMIRREENILWSFAPHDISMILSLLGEEPETALCRSGFYLHKKIADTTVSHLAFPSGAQAHIFVSWLHPFKEQKLVVVGERKMAVFNDGEPWERKLLVYPHTIAWNGQTPVPTKAEGQPIPVEPQEPLRLECAHFLECVATGQEPRTDGVEGLRVLRVLNASQLSMDKDQSACSVRLADLDGQDEWFAHETAVIDEDVEIGAGSKVWHVSHLMPGTRLGRRCNVGQNVVIGPDVRMGDGCKIQNNVSVYKGVTLEDNVFCGPSMVFTNVINPRAHIERKDAFLPTLVKKGATIGANATVVCGVTIGRYSLVGAGSVVTKDVPDHALVIGNPARRTAWVCACGEKLDAALHCPVCPNRYEEAGTGLRPCGQEP